MSQLWGFDKTTFFKLKVNDFIKLRSIVTAGKKIAIVGGGFLGSELACAISNFKKNNEKNIIQIFPESGIKTRLYLLYFFKIELVF